VATPVNKTSQAETDIAEAITYLLEQNPDAAEKFISDLQSLSRRLSQFPELYPLQRRSNKPEWRNVRMAVLRRFSHIVFYTSDNQTVVIRRIVHGARNEP
jgi:plasmid stabilization system protein ParE